MAPNAGRARSIFKSGRFYAGLVIAAAVATSLCFFTLTESGGYESSLIISIVLSLMAGIIASGEPRRVREAIGPHPGALRPALRLYLNVTSASLTMVALAMVISYINLLRAPSCDAWESAAFYLLGPAASVILACAWGLSAGLLFRSRFVPEAVFSLIWALCVFSGFYRFMNTPAVFSYGQFYGWFAGPLYDELVQINDAFITFRAGTMLQAAAVLSICHALTVPETMSFSFRRVKKGRLFYAAGFTVLFVCLHIAGPALGHRKSLRDILSALDRSIEKDGVRVHFPATVKYEDAQLLAGDARVRIIQLRRFFEIEKNPEIKILVFKSPEQKRRMTGAGSVSIAKPWRREILINMSAFPHPVLKHELAHAMAASFAPGPFKVAGGIVPVPGLIEGLAVAADFRARDGLTPHQYSAAMFELDLIPPLSEMMSVGFLGRNQRTSYTAAGSFLKFFHQKYGADEMRKLYRTADFSSTPGRSLGELERQWHAFLKTVHVDPVLRDLVALRFDVPGTVEKQCVHEVAQLNDRAFDSLASGCTQCAIEHMEKAFEKSGRTVRQELRLINTMLDAGKDDEAFELVSCLRKRKEAKGHFLAVLRGIEADIAWRRGEYTRAAELYDELVPLAGFGARARLLVAKTHGARMLERGSALRDFFAGRRNQDALTGARKLLALTRAALDLKEDGLVRYLMARRYLAADDVHGAIESLEDALSLGLESPLVRYEALRLKAVCLLRLGKIRQARKLFMLVRGDAGISEGLKTALDDWTDRCDIMLELKKEGK